MTAHQLCSIQATTLATPCRALSLIFSKEVEALRKKLARLTGAQAAENNGLIVSSYGPGKARKEQGKAINANLFHAKYLADPGETRGCSTNTVVIN